MQYRVFGIVVPFYENFHINILITKPKYGSLCARYSIEIF